mmetsp:Transcript_21001/g.23994  ORF Transcript_21001/g.23994 Transcript_21001/m.23994 type:complete len:324 (-) Transcript_21001:174-1145(-)
MTYTRFRTLILLQLTSIFISPCDSFTLITFDVDGTLVGGSGKAFDESAHARAFAYACGKVLGDGVPTQPVAEALSREEFSGSTDGLILLRLARAALGIGPSESYPKLQEMMQEMFKYINDMTDEEIAKGITPLSGVLQNLETLSKMKEEVACGLVTGNVEGIARRKMRAVGILDTGALSIASEQQKENVLYNDTKEFSFLGGFGSDYCSGNIDDFSRNHLDRAEQIAIAVERCKSLLNGEKKLSRIVHVGDAPSDVLAAKAFAQMMKDDVDVCVGMVAVATGTYSAEELSQLTGEPDLGSWEPVVLEYGMSDPDFIKACGVLP